MKQMDQISARFKAHQASVAPVEALMALMVHLQQERGNAERRTLIGQLAKKVYALPAEKIAAESSRFNNLISQIVPSYHAELEAEHQKDLQAESQQEIEWSADSENHDNAMIEPALTLLQSLLVHDPDQKII